jgi:hypothetical protein
MKTTQFRTALIMVLIPLSFFLVSEGTNSTATGDKMIFYILAVVVFGTGIWLWDKTWKQIKVEERQDKSDRNQVNDNMQTLIDELKGLRGDIQELKHEPKSKGQNTQSTKKAT